MRGRLGFWVVVSVLAAVASVQAADPSTIEVAPAAATAPVAGPTIAGNRAGDYVGQDVTVEGRAVAIHESPLATVIGFAPNFAGFTATILAADRDKFPTDLEARVRNRVVRVSGTVTAYRGKPEMALREPAQLILTPPPGVGSIAAPMPTAPPAAAVDGSAQELRRSLARIEARLQAIEDRLTTLEDGGTAPTDAAPDARPAR
ncbi:MAG: hypothetical protein ABIR79_00285 [Candidatus Binatia bacterium]